MRPENIQPRRRLMEVWKSASIYSMRTGKWTWGDSHGSNSVIDADQLLTFFLPATLVPQLNLEDINNIAPDASAALAAFGGNSQTPRILIGALEEFIGRYTRADGTCDFSGGSSLHPLDPTKKLPPEQLDIDVVPSFTASISLCLSAIGFIDGYLDYLPQRSALHPRAVKLRAALSLRLTAALVGLLRGFTLNPMTQSSDTGRRLLQLLNQEKQSNRQILEQFTERMRLVRGRLGEARLGVEKASELEDPELLFEIGWSWGIASNAPAVQLRSQEEDIKEQRTGVALSLPFIYFTMQATEAVEQLFTERTKILGLLNDEQERLAAALSIRRDLTQMYWSRLARFGDSWPLEDLPWRTLDGEESEYYSLLVCAVLVQDLVQRNANEGDLRRLEPLMSDLANRARITRRPLVSDPVAFLHAPGLLVDLDTDAPLPVPMGWRVSDFAPVLAKRSSQLAMLTSDPEVRDRLVDLGTKIWNHMQERQINSGDATGLWDNASRVFSPLEQDDGAVSWSMTARTVDAVIASSQTLNRREASSQALVDIAAAVVSETEFLLNQQLMSTPALANAPYQANLQTIGEDTRRASSLVATQPAMALALAISSINKLDSIALGRQEVERRK